MKRILVDGVEGAGLPADDPGITRGTNVFETLRTYGEAPFRQERHLERLVASAQVMGLQAPDLALLRQEIAQVVAPDVWIKILLTAGGHRIVHSEPIDQARLGAPLRLASVVMPPSPWLPGSVKHCSRAAWGLAARGLGVDEVLLTRADGEVLEANRSNVLAVRAGELLSPPADGDKLDGVTRGALLEAAHEAGLPVREVSLYAQDSFDELYVCSTLKELAPVLSLDGRSIGGGPVGQRLHRAFRALVFREAGGGTGSSAR